MRIGIDGRFLLEKNLTGVGEYASRRVSQMAEFFPNDELVVFLNSFRSVEEKRLDFLKKFSNVRIRRFGFPNKLLNLFFYFLAWPKIDRLLGGVDIFFLPNINFAPVSRDCRLLLTVHDLSFERWPETFSWKRRLWHFLVNPRRLCRRADRIWAVSGSTAEDLISLYQVQPEKIEIVYSPFDYYYFAERKEDILGKAEQIRKKYSLPNRFVLSLSTLEPRKNLVSLIRAFELWQAEAATPREKELCLVMAGGKGWLWKEIFSAIERSPVKNKIFPIGFVEKEEKKILYRLAEGFVYPSLFEGFGYPPLEAMASGVPLVASSGSSLDEVVGEAGILVDPFRPFEIFLALKEILNSEELAEFYSRRGKKKAWEVFQTEEKQTQSALEKMKDF